MFLSLASSYHQYLHLEAKKSLTQVKSWQWTPLAWVWEPLPEVGGAYCPSSRKDNGASLLPIKSLLEIFVFFNLEAQSSYVVFVRASCFYSSVWSDGNVKPALAANCVLMLA